MKHFENTLTKEQALEKIASIAWMELGTNDDEFHKNRSLMENFMLALSQNINKVKEKTFQHTEFNEFLKLAYETPRVFDTLVGWAQWYATGGSHTTKEVDVLGSPELFEFRASSQGY